MYMMYSENGAAFSAPSVISIKTPGSTQTLPWNHSLAAWDDYQSIGVDYINGSLLGAWGGDARLVTDGGAAGIWSTVLQ